MAKPAATVARTPAPGQDAPNRRGAVTRDAIDRAALELFAKRGYNATSMRAIASAAQVQPAAIISMNIS